MEHATSIVLLVLLNGFGSVLCDDKGVPGVSNVIIPWPEANANQLIAADEVLWLGSFNLEVFGKTKLGKPDVIEGILKILTKYDIVAVQEIRDVKNDSANELYRLLSEKDPDYDWYVSDFLGRSTSKEQYAIFWRKSKLFVSDFYQFNDTEHDFFERPPAGVRVKSKNSASTDFYFIDVHLKPDYKKTIEELNNLTTVLEDLYWNRAPADDKPKGILFGGDMNADCNYLSTSKFENSLLRTNDSFAWPLPEPSDTTSAQSECFYDRFVSWPNPNGDLLIPGTARAWHYYEDIGATKELAKKISDHLPIEIAIFF